MPIFPLQKIPLDMLFRQLLLWLCWCPWCWSPVLWCLLWSAPIAIMRRLTHLLIPLAERGRVRQALLCTHQALQPTKTMVNHSHRRRVTPRRHQHQWWTTRQSLQGFKTRIEIIQGSQQIPSPRLLRRITILSWTDRSNINSMMMKLFPKLHIWLTRLSFQEFLKYANCDIFAVVVHVYCVKIRELWD